MAEGRDVVIEAPPGAGKTTLVPLDLMLQPWLGEQRILLLEPRRVAARNAAERMAGLLGEPVGQRIGYTIRLDRRVSDRTRVEVITEGVLARRLQQDPSLEGVGLVVFDEFHERSLDTDLGLALCLQARKLFREGESLKIVVMSATLDGLGVADLLGDAPIVRSTGRQYPIEITYGEPYQLGDAIEPRVAAAVFDALEERPGNILVFLPGQREIHSTMRELAQAMEPAQARQVTLAPLYGGLSLKQQRQAISEPPPGETKVVLSTNLAETSLTIEGISTVIDSGLARDAMFDAGSGMTRLITRRVSRASADQRAGRAGRLGPGFCLRLWSEEQHSRLVKHSTPEIEHADLANLALQLLAWGVAEPGELMWLDPPAAGPYAQALDVLQMLDAVFIEPNGTARLTPHGVRLAQMPLHPRLAHMLLVGCDIHANETAALIAAILAERNPLAREGADVGSALSVLMGEKRCPRELQVWYERTWQQARRYAAVAAEVHRPREFALQVDAASIPGVLLASAYPDRIARRRGFVDQPLYQLSNGRGARLAAADGLAASEWLAVAETGARRGDRDDRIYMAAALSPEYFDSALSSLVQTREHVDWDDRQARFVAERRRSVGELVLAVEPLKSVSHDARVAALVAQLEKRGLADLPWTDAAEQWRSRVMLCRRLWSGTGDNPWPDLSDGALLSNLSEWLGPHLGGINRLADFASLDLSSILKSSLDWSLSLDLERLAPERITIPSGASATLDYRQQPPVLAVKLQEMFGCEETPTVGDGQQRVALHLLSPARRPLQVTQDLAGFWRGSYHEVKKEMRGRYPKHPWPDDPLAAEATAKTRRSSRKS